MPMLAGLAFSPAVHASDLGPAAQLAQAGTAGDAATIARLLGQDLRLTNLDDKSESIVLTPETFAERVKGCDAYFTKEPQDADPAAMVAWICEGRPIPTNKCRDTSFEVMFYPPGPAGRLSMDWTGVWAKRCGPPPVPPVSKAPTNG
ncbi:MAG TPA: hypothetical protein VF481_01610 [Novosphingobium sp.]